MATIGNPVEAGGDIRKRVEAGGDIRNFVEAGADNGKLVEARAELRGLCDIRMPELKVTDIGRIFWGVTCKMGSTWWRGRCRGHHRHFPDRPGQGNTREHKKGAFILGPLVIWERQELTTILR